MNRAYSITEISQALRIKRQDIMLTLKSVGIVTLESDAAKQRLTCEWLTRFEESPIVTSWSVDGQLSLWTLDGAKFIRDELFKEGYSVPTEAVMLERLASF